MGAQLNRWAFIVPGEFIAVKHPELVTLLEQTNRKWEDFMYLALVDVLSHLNRLGLEDFLDGVKLIVEESKNEQNLDVGGAIDCIVVDIMEGFDLLESDGEIGEKIFENQYAIFRAAAITVLKMAIRFIAIMFENPRQYHGMPYELNLDRCVGRDLVFTISYM